MELFKEVGFRFEIKSAKRTASVRAGRYEKAWKSILKLWGSIHDHPETLPPGLPNTMTKHPRENGEISIPGPYGSSKTGLALTH